MDRKLGKTLFSALQFMRKQGADLFLFLVYGQFADVSDNYKIKYSLIVEKYVYNRIVTNNQTVSVLFSFRSSG